MAVVYNETKKIFSLHTRNSTYQMKADDYGYLLHLYYGKRISADMDYLLPFYDRGFSGNPYDAGEDRTYSLDVLPQEFPVLGTGDFRDCALKIREENGCYNCDLRYVGHRILDGKYTLPGLPAAYAKGSVAQTLEMVLADKRCGVRVTLLYGVLEECDIITRSVRIENTGNKKLYLEKISSSCLDFLYGNYDVIAFYGRHAMERNVQRVGAIHGRQVFGSTRGASSHQYNPFVILAQHNATEQAGECYGAAFVYSGNFSAEIEKDQFDQTRFVMGLSEEQFSYPLDGGGVFYAPEVALSYSGEGLACLSHNFHRFAGEHICRGKYKDQVRPVLLNSWEACYFDFDGEKIVALAKQAAELGVELLVLDDGWFGQRNDDNSSLGDWEVNEEKLGCSLKELSERVHQEGVRFGIWIEPEMVSENSDLYRNHPDWALQIPGKKPVRARNQLVLDFSNPLVAEYILEKISTILRQARVDYVKWDMNRSLADIYSANAEEQGAVSYDYMLGVYRLLEALTFRFPDILWEGCCGGGGRFDLGMLYYTPQIWCSDNTDAIDRVRIQYGTSFGYPLSAVGAHVSAVPNHQTGRSTNLNTRGVVAMTGAFGYELDFGKLCEQEKEEIRKQIAVYHKIAPLLLNGDYYRISDPFADEYGAWMVVDAEKKKALLSVVILNIHGNMPVIYMCLAGLDPAKQYRENISGKIYSGEALMAGGLPIALTAGDYPAYQVMFEAVDVGA
ncbi:MAG: alpha-galactosidase [Lachnospiraceae bacterium]|nr:alpha-galactosidase [Lachnospiraceae bacterium]